MQDCDESPPKKWDCGASDAESKLDSPTLTIYCTSSLDSMLLFHVLWWLCTKRIMLVYRPIRLHNFLNYQCLPPARHIRNQLDCSPLGPMLVIGSEGVRTCLVAKYQLALTLAGWIAGL